MSIIDTPDWQNGVVSAQSLLATVAAGTKTTTVTLPPNITTLAVYGFDIGQEANVVECLGVTSGFKYPGTTRRSPPDVNAENAVFFVVSQPLDAQVTISLSVNASQAWWVVSMTGVNVVDVPAVSGVVVGPGAASPPLLLQVGGTDGTDARTLLVDPSGRQIVTPVAANTTITGSVANGTTILAAPAAGTVNRIFTFLARVVTVPEIVNLSGVASSAIYAATIHATASAAVQAAPLGPVDITEALKISDTINAQTIFYTLSYRNMPAS